MATTREYQRIRGDCVESVQEMVGKVVTLKDWLEQYQALMPSAARVSPRLPANCAWSWQDGNLTTFLIEEPPRVRHVTWEWAVGLESSRENHVAWQTRFSLAMPYVIFVVRFLEDCIIPHLSSCFARSTALAKLEDPLCWPPLSNVGYTSRCPGSICTGDMRVSGTTLAQKANSFATAFWGADFNRDLHNYVMELGVRDPRFASPCAWEAATKEDPLFVLGATFLAAGVTAGQALAWKEGV